MTDAGIATIVDRFQGSPLLAAGRVNVIALDAIRDRFGGRWKLRQHVVREQAESVLRRQVGEHSIIQPISETEFIVAQPEVSRLTGQTLCLNALRAILHHFLGEALLGDLKVHEVTRITETGVFGQRLDAAAIEAVDAIKPPHLDAIEAGDAAEASRPEATAPPRGTDERPRRSLDRWTPFASSTGRRIGVSASLQPVMQLKNSAPIGYRVTRRILQVPSHATLSARDFRALSPADIEKIDLASIARGVDRVRASEAREKPLSLVLAVSYTTLRSRRARAALLGLLEQARAAVQHGLIVEISGVDGAPAAALPEVISVLRPLCVHVIGRLSDGLDQDVRFLRGVGLTGLSVRCPSTDGDAQFIGWAKTLVVAATRVARTLFVYDLPGIARAKLAATLGITHATLAPQRLQHLHVDDEVPVGEFRPAAKTP